MVDKAEEINRFFREAEHAKERLSQMLGTPLSIGDIEDGLVVVEGLENGYDLLDKEWTADSIIQRLHGFDFSVLHKPGPSVLCVVELDSSLIPDGVPKALNEKIVKQFGCIWEIHKYDDDPFPSNPHAHNYDSGLKLSLADGGLYRKRMRVGEVGKKKLLMLRDRLSDIELPPLTI
jgi:hypothetical protein